MKKHLRKVTALLLIILLLAAAGCTDSTKPSDSSSTTTKSQTTQTQTEKPSETEDPNLISFPYTGPEITFSFLFADLGQSKEITDNMIVAKKALEMMGNFKLELELLPWSDYDTKQSLYLSSGEVPDMMVTRDVVSVVRQYGPNEIFLDYAPLMAKYMPNFSQVTDKYAAFDLLTNEDGKMYGLAVGFQDEDWAMEGWFYNKSVLSDHNITVPKTKDDLLTALRDIKAADPEIIPFNNVLGMGYMETAMSHMYDSTDSGVQYNSKTKQWEFGPTKAGSQFKSFLQFLNTLWAEELVNPELNTATDEQVAAQVGAGNWGFSYYYFGIKKDNGYTSDNFGAMLCPTGDNGTAYSTVTSPYDGAPYWGLTTGVNTEHPEILAQCIDYCFSKEWTDLKVWGIEGETYTINSDGQYEYMPDIATGLNPNGSKQFADLGFGGAPAWLQLGYGVVASNKLKSYDIFGIEAEAQNRNALDDGTLKARYGISTPSVTPEEAELISTILTPIQTYIDESKTKFIMGDMSFDKWDEFIAKIGTYGDIQTVLDIYNSKEMVQFGGNWR